MEGACVLTKQGPSTPPLGIPPARGGSDAGKSWTKGYQCPLNAWKFARVRRPHHHHHGPRGPMGAKISSCAIESVFGSRSEHAGIGRGHWIPFVPVWSAGGGASSEKLRERSRTGGRGSFHDCSCITNNGTNEKWWCWIFLVGENSANCFRGRTSWARGAREKVILSERICGDGRSNGCFDGVVITGVDGSTNVIGSTGERGGGAPFLKNGYTSARFPARRRRRTPVGCAFWLVERARRCRTQGDTTLMTKGSLGGVLPTGGSA